MLLENLDILFNLKYSCFIESMVCANVFMKMSSDIETVNADFKLEAKAEVLLQSWLQILGELQKISCVFLCFRCFTVHCVQSKPQRFNLITDSLHVLYLLISCYG